MVYGFTKAAEAKKTGKSKFMTWAQWKHLQFPNTATEQFAVKRRMYFEVFET